MAKHYAERHVNALQDKKTVNRKWRNQDITRWQEFRWDWREDDQVGYHKEKDDLFNMYDAMTMQGIVPKYLYID